MKTKTQIARAQRTSETRFKHTPSRSEAQTLGDWRPCNTDRDQMASPIRNQNGFFMVNIAVFMLLLVGTWFIWHSFSQGNLRNDAQSIYNDYTNVVTNHILPKIRR